MVLRKVLYGDLEFERKFLRKIFGLTKRADRTWTNKQLDELMRNTGT
jgi:hypothetical protein